LSATTTELPSSLSQSSSSLPSALFVDWNNRVIDRGSSPAIVTSHSNGAISLVNVAFKESDNSSVNASARAEVAGQWQDMSSRRGALHLMHTAITPSSIRVLTIARSKAGT
jgi:hypothetical protein